MMPRPRTLPNIILTGTPGVGKTLHCTNLLSHLPSTLSFTHLSINQIVKDRGCHEGWDEELKTWIVDEDRLLDELEGILGGEKEGYLIDWHACDLFPKRWVDLVVVLRCGDTRVLWDRLSERKYPERKLQENLDAEIFGVLAEEAREAYDEEIVVELKSENDEDVEENCERIGKWIESWMEQNKAKGEGCEDEAG